MRRMDTTGLRELFDRQAGVVSRRQLAELGATDHDVRRLVRRRDLSRVHRGVYVNHTGPLTWASRAWAAVLFYAPAALCGESALTPAGDVIHVAIEHPRNATPIEGVRLHRLVDLDRKVLWNYAPPRLRVEEAVLDLAAEASTRSEAIALIGDACQRRRTTPARLADALAGRARLTKGAWLREVLDDAGAGALSVLEQSYLRRVERAHGLPRPQRQQRERTEHGVRYRDVLYDAQRLVVELDGRIGHTESRDRWNDMDRDLTSALGGRMTVRLGWRHCEERACQTAGRLAVLLQRRGWGGSPQPCGPACSLSGDFQSRGA